MKIPQGLFSQRVVDWQTVSGRHHLPWQQTQDPYRVWLSEIMLQQTQVSTVLGYYARFLTRFPDVFALAEASQDDVMALWSGLGYYSRARNLHRCAQIVVREHGGVFPSTSEALAKLPGIGRSTAAAIASFCFAEAVPIMDANVKRVLTRVLAFDGDLAVAKNERTLWGLAEELLPRKDLANAMPRYTQGLMDLGAMVCLPRKPDCVQCPIQHLCQAHQLGDPTRFPVRTKKLMRRSQVWWVLIVRNAVGDIWLHKRPQSGIWAGLYCPPVFDDRDAVMGALRQSLGASPLTLREPPPFLHVLTHRDLYLHPVEARWGYDGDGCAVASDGGWFSLLDIQRLGVPAPIRTYIEGALG